MSYCKDNEVLGQIFKKFSSASSGEWNFTQLPLEFMLEASYAEGMRDFVRVLTFMRDSEPAWIHKTIMDLCQLGMWSEVLTTNFDICLEKTVPIISGKVTHLHGSMENPGSLVLTIQSIGSGLPLHIVQIIRKVHQSKNLLFIGYSGYDADILDVLQSVDGKPVFWLCQDNEMAGISRRAGEFIKNVGGVSIIGDLLILLNEIRMLIGLQVIPTGQCNCVLNWEQHVSEGIEYLPLGDRARFVARICLEANDHKNAIKAYHLSIEKTKSPVLKSKALGNLSFVFYMMRNMEKLRSLSLKALHYAKVAKNPRHFAHAINNIGLSFIEGNTDDLHKSISYFEKAAIIHEKLANNAYKRPENLRGASQSLNNLGVAYTRLNKPTEAVNAFLRSISIKDELGDLIGKAISSANLAHIECRQGDWINGIKRHQDSIKILRHFSKLISVGYFTGQMGICFADAGKKEEARSLLKEAISIFKFVDGPKKELEKFESKLAELLQD
jgi:tetratricopeptide (TPR) repeat protein